MSDIRDRMSEFVRSHPDEVALLLALVVLALAAVTWLWARQTASLRKELTALRAANRAMLPEPDTTDFDSASSAGGNRAVAVGGRQVYAVAKREEQPVVEDLPVAQDSLGWMLPAEAVDAAPAGEAAPRTEAFPVHRWEPVPQPEETAASAAWPATAEPHETEVASWPALPGPEPDTAEVTPWAASAEPQPVLEPSAWLHAEPGGKSPTTPHEAAPAPPGGLDETDEADPFSRPGMAVPPQTDAPRARRTPDLWRAPASPAAGSAGVGRNESVAWAAGLDEAPADEAGPAADEEEAVVEAAPPGPIAEAEPPAPAPTVIAPPEVAHVAYAAWDAVTSAGAEAPPVAAGAAAASDPVAYRAWDEAVAHGEETPAPAPAPHALEIGEPAEAQPSVAMPELALAGGEPRAEDMGLSAEGVARLDALALAGCGDAGDDEVHEAHEAHEDVATLEAPAEETEAEEPAAEAPAEETEGEPEEPAAETPPATSPFVRPVFSPWPTAAPAGGGEAAAFARPAPEPAAAPPADLPPAPATPAVPAIPVGGVAGAATDILLVEDDENVGKVYRLLLESKGYTVRHAVDGVAGLDFARMRRPDLILLDVMMPRMNGILFLQSLRAQPELAAVPVVILSNFREPRLVDRALALGALEYMVKAQTRPDALLSAVPHWLRGERAFSP